jgi:hypothetical protein
VGWLAAAGFVGLVGWVEHRRDVEARERLAAMERLVLARQGQDAQAPRAEHALRLLTWHAAPPEPAAPPACPSTAVPANAPEPERPPPSPAQAEHVARAQALLDASLSRRVLRREDVVAMRRELLAAEQPEAFLAMRQRIVVAINRDELVPEDFHSVVP